VLILVLLAAIIGSTVIHPGSWPARFKVGLGLDLSSGSTVTLKAVPGKPGTQPSQQAMKQAITILLNRVNGAGLNGATVQQQGTDIINVSVPGQTSQQVINLIGYTAKLRFRQVLLCTTNVPGSAQCGPESTLSTPSGSPSPSPAASGGSPPASPSRAPSGSRPASPSGTPTASTKAARSGGGTAVTADAQHARPAGTGPAAGASPAPRPSGSPRAGSGSPSPSGSHSRPR
jgi:preprotein translocase subunit SecD